MIQRGSRVHTDQRRPIYRATDDLPLAATNERHHQQDDKPQNAAKQSEAMGECVREFFNGDVLGDRPGPGNHRAIECATVPSSATTSRKFLSNWRYQINCPRCSESAQKPGAPVEAGRISGAFTPNRKRANHDWLRDINPVYKYPHTNSNKNGTVA